MDVLNNPLAEHQEHAKYDPIFQKLQKTEHAKLLEHAIGIERKIDRDYKKSKIEDIKNDFCLSHL
jgi:hypothetical protein